MNAELVAPPDVSLHFIIAVRGKEVKRYGLDAVMVLLNTALKDNDYDEEKARLAVMAAFERVAGSV